MARPGERWKLKGMDQPEVAGCTDVDLNSTPATNLIAIHCLALGVGRESDAPAAWLHFPECTLERLEQWYHRVTPNAYDYQASRVGYSGLLQVSDFGFVTPYPGLWALEALQ
jgi:uncharacterized protein